MKRFLRLCVAGLLALPLVGLTALGPGPATAAPGCQPGAPAPADPYPGTAAADTNFESGTLAPFTAFTAVTGTASVSSALSHSPGCAAHLHATTDNGSIAKISVGLASGMKEAYTDGWFNITTEGVSGNDVPYFRFFSGGIRFLDVFRHNISNDLVLRVTSANGFVYTTLVPSVALGSWHHLIMHVVPKGATTGVQIWWDDKSVFSQTVSISATQLDTVQLGAEHDQQKGDVYADDVIINSGSETPTPVPGPLPAVAPPPAPAPSGGGTVPAAATSGIRAAAVNANLGTSTSAITCGLVNGGCFQNYTGGAVMWSPAAGAQVTPLGPVRDAWAAHGYETGSLGYPTSNEVCGLRNGGCFQNFQRGAIMWSPASGAHLSVGAIRQAWAARGYEGGSLAYPTSDEVCGLRNGGCFQNYQGGAILWSPASGAHATPLDAMRSAWAAQGYETGSLGYPTSDEVCGLRNGGCFQNYQGGAVMWSQASGAHLSLGAIRQAWAAQGYEMGKLGYPTSNEYISGSGSVTQDYQGGKISWSPVTGIRIT